MPYLKIETHPSIPRRINYKGKYCGTDTPGKNSISIRDFHNYPIQNFSYTFNNWGFRDEDFGQHLGNKVNICLGDSVTTNFGGPAEHSWPSQLKKYFNIPTLNFGMEAAGNDAIFKVYESVVKLFDVQNTFVMYSFLHRRLINGKFDLSGITDDEENFTYFAKQRIPNSIECACPSWVYTDEEKEFLQEQKIFFLDVPFSLNFSDFTDIDRKYVVEELYNALRGTDWPSYMEFINGAEPHEDMFTKKFGNFISKLQFGKNISKNIYTNRDGIHLNQEANKIYADYFYNQWKQKNES